MLCRIQRCYAKAVSVSVHCEEDPWEKYYLKFEEPDCEIVPVGCVLTMVGTGSEMNAGTVITNRETKLKIGHVFADELGLVMNISELGADEGMLERLADSTLILDGGYKVPEHDDIVTIFRNSL